MKRLHVSVAVSDLDHSVQFYATLFGAEPTVLKSDYAKWMLEDPRVNFSIASRGARKGVDHLGIQVEDDAELAAVAGARRAGEAVRNEGDHLLHARSNKAWVHDPEGRLGDLPPSARARSMARTAPTTRRRGVSLLHADSGRRRRLLLCAGSRRETVI
jgi:catechol 2,3-dioxygenase-like lactoylglutathione lyase family enzyme